MSGVCQSLEVLCNLGLPGQLRGGPPSFAEQIQAHSRTPFEQLAKELIERGRRGMRSVELSESRSRHLQQRADQELFDIRRPGRQFGLDRFPDAGKLPGFDQLPQFPGLILLLIPQFDIVSSGLGLRGRQRIERLLRIRSDRSLGMDSRGAWRSHGRGAGQQRLIGLPNQLKLLRMGIRLETPHQLQVGAPNRRFLSPRLNPKQGRRVVRPVVGISRQGVRLAHEVRS